MRWSIRRRIGHRRELVERLRRVAQDFARQHLLLDQKFPDAEKRQYTLVMGMRSWLFEHFRHLQRNPVRPP